MSSTCLPLTKVHLTDVTTEQSVSSRDRRYALNLVSSEDTNLSLDFTLIVLNSLHPSRASICSHWSWYSE